MFHKLEEKITFEDDTKEKVVPLIEHRFPWLIIGLVGGIIAVIVSSSFGRLLEKNIQLAFFIPVIVYMSAAVGSQTGTIYVRNLVKKDVSFSKYFLKELILGTFLGAFFGILLGGFAYFWLKDIQIAFTVGLAMFATILTAPIIALLIPTVLFKEHTDPAVGAGPFSTVIQDITSIFIYLLIAYFVVTR